MSTITTLQTVLVVVSVVGCSVQDKLVGPRRQEQGAICQGLYFSPVTIPIVATCPSVIEDYVELRSYGTFRYISIVDLVLVDLLWLLNYVT